MKAINYVSLIILLLVVFFAGVAVGDSRLLNPSVSTAYQYSPSEYQYLVGPYREAFDSIGSDVIFAVVEEWEYHSRTSWHNPMNYKSDEALQFMYEVMDAYNSYMELDLGWKE